MYLTCSWQWPSLAATGTEVKKPPSEMGKPRGQSGHSSPGGRQVQTADSPPSIRLKNVTLHSLVSPQQPHLCLPCIPCEAELKGTIFEVSRAGVSGTLVRGQELLSSGSDHTRWWFMDKRSLRKDTVTGKGKQRQKRGSNIWKIYQRFCNEGIVGANGECPKWTFAKGVGRIHLNFRAFCKKPTFSLLFKSGSNKVPKTLRLGNSPPLTLYSSSGLQSFVKASLFYKAPQVSLPKSLDLHT